MWISLWVLTCAHGTLRKCPAAAMHAQHPSTMECVPQPRPCVSRHAAWQASTHNFVKYSNGLVANQFQSSSCAIALKVPAFTYGAANRRIASAALHPQQTAFGCPCWDCQQQ